MLVVLASCATLPARPAHPDPAEALDQVLQSLLREHDFPGVSLAVLRDGELLYARAFGVADRRLGTSLAPAQRLRIASVAKPLTALAVLRLVQEDHLALDAPVVPLLAPRLSPGFHVDPGFARLRVHHLLNHCGGWDREADFDPVLQSRYMAAMLGLPRPPTALELVEWALSRPPDFRPGLRCVYSNLGYAVLGRLLEAVTGLDYESAVRALVLQPAGLDGVRLAATLPSARQPDEPRYHDERRAPSAFDASVEVALPDGGIAIEAMDASGGWIATASDLVRLVAALEGHRGEPLLSRDLRRAMLTPVALHDGDAYGFGWDIGARGTRYWHAGNLPGSAAVLMREPDGTVWALLANGPLDDARAAARMRRSLGTAARRYARARDAGSAQAAGADP